MVKEWVQHRWNNFLKDKFNQNCLHVWRQYHKIKIWQGSGDYVRERNQHAQLIPHHKYKNFNVSSINHFHDCSRFSIKISQIKLICITYKQNTFYKTVKDPFMNVVILLKPDWLSFGKNFRIKIKPVMSTITPKNEEYENSNPAHVAL